MSSEEKNQAFAAGPWPGLTKLELVAAIIAAGVATRRTDSASGAQTAVALAREVLKEASR